MYNRIIVIGRLVADPELRATPNGVNVASFRVAVNRPRDKEKSDFFNVVAWRQNAEFITRYFSKGKLIGIEGSLQTRDYTDKEGNRRTAFEIQAERAFFTETKGGTPSGSNEFTAVDIDDDLPF